MPNARLAALLWSFVALSVARADEPPRPLTLMTWNVEWFFDNYTEDNFTDLPKQEAAPSRAEWDWKLAGVAKAIAEVKPTILCLQEVENRRVLFYLTKKLRDEHKLNYKIAYIEGEDYFTEQDTAILWQSGLVEFSRREQTQEDRARKEFYGVPKHIFGRFTWGGGENKDGFTLLNVHMRAQPEGTSIRERQARLMRRWLEAEFARGEQVVVIGDVNSNESFEETTPAGDVGILRGLNTADMKDDLIDLHQFLEPERRFSHIIAKSFDRILVSPALVADEPGRTDLVFKKATVPKELVIRGKEQDKDHLGIFWTIPQEERDLSDHWPVVAEFEWK